jgi:hypothetical protein
MGVSPWSVVWVANVVGLLGACSYPPLAQQGGVDGGADAMAGMDADQVDTDAAPASRLQFNIADFNVAQRQNVRFRVLRVQQGTSDLDVSEGAAFLSDLPAIATVPRTRRITSGTQAGTATISATFEDAAPASLKVTVTAAACHPVINELATGSAISPADEWIELYNPCDGAINVDGWTLVYRGSGTTTGPDSTLLITLAGQMASEELRLYAGSAYVDINDGKWPAASGLLAESNGAVGLRAGPMTTGPLVDSIAYGSVFVPHPFVETTATQALARGRSASRMPFDGKDDNNGALDFVIDETPTPHALNAP